MFFDLLTKNEVDNLDLNINLNQSILVIPDIHGRSFWKEAVNNWEGLIIFLGDYLDIYPDEGISKKEAIRNFEEILKSTKNKNIVLLLGNHDLQYIYNTVNCCRHDYSNGNKISKLFKEHLNLFKLYYKINNVLFSHAGITPDWLFNNKFKSIEDIPTIDDYSCMSYLWQISTRRGGYYDFGSCVWADLTEFLDLQKSEYYQIFGHTQLDNQPLISSTWACLDCRKPFIISKNKITEWKN